LTKLLAYVAYSCFQSDVFKLPSKLQVHILRRRALSGLLV
jgi:hypothetical protein